MVDYRLTLICLPSVPRRCAAWRLSPAKFTDEQHSLVTAVSPAVVRNAGCLTEGSAELLFGLLECFDYNPGAVL